MTVKSAVKSIYKESISGSTSNLTLKSVCAETIGFRDRPATLNVPGAVSTARISQEAFVVSIS